jgi:hypothetical protein
MIDSFGEAIGSLAGGDGLVQTQLNWNESINAGGIAIFSLIPPTEKLTETIEDQGEEIVKTNKELDDYLANLQALSETDLKGIEEIDLLNAELQGLTQTADEMTAAALGLDEMQIIDPDLFKGINEGSQQFKKDIQGLAEVAEPFAGDLLEIGLALDEIEESIPEKGLENLLDLFKDNLELAAQLDQQFKGLGVTIVSSIGQGLGEAAAGVKSFGDTLDELSTMIVAALGDIFIAAGISQGIFTPQGLALVLTGLGFKAAGSFGASRQSMTMGGGQSPFPNTRPYGGNAGNPGASVLYGNDIRNSNNYYTDLYNRVG